MKNPVNSINRKVGFTRIISLAAIVLIAAVFISALPTIKAQAESSSSFGLADLFGGINNVSPLDSSIKTDGSSSLTADNRSPDAVNNYAPVRTTGITYSSISATGTSPGAFRNGSNTDDNLTENLPLGFTFIYNGQAVQSFRMSTSGFLTFNTTSTATGGGTGAYGYQNTQFSATGGTTNTLAPFYDDQQTGANAGTLADLQASLKYQTTGAIGSRVLTAEWINFQDFATASTSSLNYQVKLYEADGHIEFVYGTINVGNTTATTFSYTVGINAATIAATPTAAELLTQQTANTATFSNLPQNALTVLPASNTQINFTPPAITPAAPTNLTFTNIGSSSVTLNWVDNATNETNYNVLISTDGGVTFQTFGAVYPPNTMTATISGLAPSTTYFFRVIATTEGFASAPLDGSVTTSPPISGTKTIGPGGDFPTFAAAITEVNSGTGAGGVTFNIAAGTTFPENGTCITGGSAANPIIFQKTGTGANPIIQPSGTTGTQDSGICILGGDYVTFNGIDVAVASGNTAVEYGALVFNSSATNGATNNTIQNSRITLNRTNTGSLGIIQTFSAAATAATGANSNNHYYNITVENASRGILLNGTATAFPDTNNEIGVTGGGTTTIGAATANDIGNGTASTYGVAAALQFGVKIFNVEVRNVTGTSTGTVDGILLSNTGSTTTSIGTNQIYNNRIHDLNNTSTTAGRVVGIRESLTNNAGSVLLAYNNFVYNLNSSSTVTASRRIIGIFSQDQGVGTASTHNYLNNSVRIAPTNVATSNSNFELGVATNINNVQNNIFANFTGAQTGTAKHYTYVSTSATALGGTGSVSNYNDLYVANTTNGFVGLGSATDYATLANFQAAFTTGGTNANSISADPNFFSATDLHLNSPSPAIDAGTTLASVMTDIDGQPRPNGTAYDIGADEFVPSPGTVQLSSTVFSATEASGSATITITRAGGSSGAASVMFATSNGTATGGTSCTAGVDYITTSGTVNFADGDTTPKTFTITICPDADFEPSETVNITLTSATGAALGTPNTAVLTIQNSAIFNGTNVNVGTGQTFTSLTSAGGLFDAINNGTVTANTTITITSSLTETGAISLNQFAGGFTLTIKPAGAGTTISGAVASGALIKLNGADNVVIDGSTNGGTDRSLTITNTSTTSPTAIQLISLGTGAGATNNTIKNTNISTGLSGTTGYGIAIGGATPGGSGADNDTNTLQNNSISVATVGIYAVGTASASAGGMDTLSVVGNTIDSNTTISPIGIQVGNGLNSTINQNTISVQTSGSVQPVGISLETGFVSSTVSRNNITKVLTTATGGYGGRGITVGTGTATSALTISNNFVSGVNGSNYSSFTNSSSFGIGIGVIGGSGTLTTVVGGVNLYSNSVNMSGTYNSNFANVITTALYVGTGASALDIENNIFVNTLNNTNATNGATSKNYAIYSAAAITAFTTIDYNDYYVAGTQGVLGFIGSDRTNLAGIQAGFGQNLNSKTIDPVFASASDLHLQATSTLLGQGIAIPSVIVDIDGDTRETPPDIGADEIVTANTSPTITAVGVTRQAGSPASNSTIANVNDAESGANGVTVDIVGSTTVNGVTISNIINNNGTVTADVVAACGATNASFTLRASDGSLTSTAMLNVTVNANTAPTLAYGNASVVFGGSTTINPTTAPGDNGSVSSIAVQSQGTYTGTISVNNTTGVVSISNAMPAGTHTITIRATDNCGLTTDATFTLTVGAQPALSINDVSLSEGNSGTTTFAFTVSLNSPAGAGGVSFDIATANGTATAGSDYAAQSLTGQTISAGSSLYTFNVSVNGDTTFEPNETFFVNVSNVTGATVADGQGLGTIVNDDVADMTAPVISPYTPLPAKASEGTSTLNVNVTDNVAVQNVSITYAIGNGAPTTMNCTPNGGSSYLCMISETGANGQTISYYVSATDTSNNSSSLPAVNMPNGYAVGGVTVQSGTYTNLNINGGSLGGNVLVLGTFNFNNVLSENGNTLEIGCDGQIVRGSTTLSVIINGNVQKDLCAPQAFTFPVGNSTAVPTFAPDGTTPPPAIYSPVTANVTAATNPSSLTVSVTDDFMPGSTTTSSVSRYWTLTEGGSITANLSFTYDQSDVNGNESTYKVIKNENGSTSIFNDSTVNTDTNTATVLGISDFSLWSVGNLIPTAATADISGYVRNIHGRRLEYVNVTLSGGSLSEPLTVTTDISGRFHFIELPVNETYILSVRSKRYRFSQPTTVFTINGNLSNVTFISEN